MPTSLEQADQTDTLRRADPSGLVRGMGSVCAVWGTLLIACHFAFGWPAWTFAAGLTFWAAALATARRS